MEIKVMDIIDFHIHPLLGFISIENILWEMDRAGVGKGVLIAIDVDPKDVERKDIWSNIENILFDLCIWDTERVKKHMASLLEKARIDNRVVSNLVRKSPERFYGLGSVNVSKGSKYVKKALEELKDDSFIGVKLYPSLQFFNPSKSKGVRKICEFCRREGKILMFHTGCDPGIWEKPQISEFSRPRLIEPLTRKFKDITFILAHIGSYSALLPKIWFEEAVNLASKYDNVWLDTSAVAYLFQDEDAVSRLREAGLMDRLLFGSDYPVVMGASIMESVNQIIGSNLLKGKEKELILGQNARKILMDF